MNKRFVLSIITLLILSIVSLSTTSCNRKLYKRDPYRGTSDNPSFNNYSRAKSKSYRKVQSVRARPSDAPRRRYR